MALVPRELLPPLRPLGEMKGDVAALTKDFFAAWAAKLTPTLAEKCTNWGNYFLEAHGRADLGAIFKLKPAKAREGLASVGLDEGWLETFEEEAGFTFTDHGVPASAALCPPSQQSRGQKMVAKTTNLFKQTEVTIAQELINEGRLDDERLPTQALDAVVDTVDPKTTTITKMEVRAIVREVRKKYYRSHGRGNLGMPLIRHLAKQLHHRYPRLPRHGSTPGADRSWVTILENGQENGTHVRASLSNSARRAAPHASACARLRSMPRRMY